ncbi:hypothetical protein Dxin01_00298 [Deinococcus xinjiangensis]|uniref:Uncharacterized protein n=1 Tax=Deinococcus xinjiangensis TaxID=457454 RepID=A0ABP9V5L6_9DEIO
MNAVSHLLGRLAAAEAQAHARFSATPQQFGPLLAVWAGPESPLSTAWHAGTGLPSAADWQACEDFFAAQGHGCTVHLLSHAAPELLPSLLERGYGLSYVLHAYGHDLQVLPPLGRPQITELPDAEADAWANISARGFGPEAEAVMRQVSRAAGTRRLVAWQAGQPAASAAVSLVNGVAAFLARLLLPNFALRACRRRCWLTVCIWPKLRGPTAPVFLLRLRRVASAMCSGPDSVWQGCASP